MKVPAWSLPLCFIGGLIAIHLATPRLAGWMRPKLKADAQTASLIVGTSAISLEAPGKSSLDVPGKSVVIRLDSRQRNDVSKGRPVQVNGTAYPRTQAPPGKVLAQEVPKIIEPRGEGAMATGEVASTAPPNEQPKPDAAKPASLESNGLPFSARIAPSEFALFEEKVGLCMKVLLSLVFGGASLYVVLSKKYSPQWKHWASGTIGMILGTWFRG
jgi:hypothetical protein